MNASSNCKCKCKCNCNCKCKCKRKKKVYRLPRVSPSVLSNRGDVCPPATLPNELPECEQRRQDVSGDVFNADNGWQIGFVNQLMNFNDITDNLNPNSCEGTFGVGWHLATVEEFVIPDVSEVVAEILQPFCPVLVWTTNNGIPTLAYVFPGRSNPIEIVPTPSLSCLAYHFCINSGG